MFSNKIRCLYRRNQLAEVICQLRFPEILSIEANAPVDFQEAIRQEFPQFQRRQDIPAPTLTGVPGNMTVQHAPAITNYQFSSADGIWRVNLTGRFISLTCSRYTCWEDFAGKLDKPLAAFIQIYKPAYFERVGLRYLNFISREKLQLEDVPYRDLIAPAYLGLLQEEDIVERQVNRCSTDAEVSLNGGCNLKMHAGPGLVTQNGEKHTEIKFILDLDFFMNGNVPVNYSTGALKSLHAQAYPIFRDAITDTLHNAMDPISG